MTAEDTTTLTSARLDLWLWSVRIFKTRSLAADECKGGHVRVNDAPAKPSQKLKKGDVVRVRYPGWERVFKVKPEVFTEEEKRAWLAQMTDVTVGSDAFFPFSDNIERAKKSGVKYIAEPGGSVRDDLVIETCDKYDMVMAFTGIRLFHH